MEYNNFFDYFHIYDKDISNLTGIVTLYHNKKDDGNYANLGEEINVFVKIPRSILTFGAQIVVIDAYKNKVVSEISGTVEDYDLLFDYLKFKIGNLKSRGLFFYYFRFSALKNMYGYRQKNDVLSFCFELPKESSLYQFTITQEKNCKNEMIRGIMYHIFVDRFCRGGEVVESKNAIMIENWKSEIQEYPEYPGAYLKNNTFFGGTINGITKKLKYLKSIGVAIIYLSPIFESPSNHKYDTGDYEKIDEMFGGESAFCNLIQKAKELNIEIILDGVFNHTGADSKYFNKFSNYDSIGAFQSKNSRYYDWYRFESYPDKYECWWGIDILPKIYYESGDAENYFLGENGVVEKWMKFGIKGFRLDVADELSDTFIEKMRALISEHNEAALLYGEVWEDASNKIAYGKRKKYYLGSELTGVMNYPLKNGIISYIRRKNVAEIEYALKCVMLNMPIKIRNTAMNIMGSHDTERIITAMGGEYPYGKTNKELLNLKMTTEQYTVAKKRVMSAYTIIATLPGIPTVFYGDEAGVEGYSDPFNRKTFPWGDEDPEILSHFKKTGSFRIDYTILFDGEFYILHLDKDFLIFERKKGKDRLLTAYNNTGTDVKISFSKYATELYQNLREKEFILSSECAYVFKINVESEFEIGC